MFDFTQGGGVVTAILGWLMVFAALFALNEVTRRFKWVGFAAFVVMPIVLTVLWFTVLDGKAYKDWFHLAKVYSSTAGCIFFWCIRFVGGTKKDGTKWRLADKKGFLFLAFLILAINILEACIKDFEVGNLYYGIKTLVEEQGTNGATKFNLMGGSWNYMNGIAGILNIITITGWFGICISKDKSKDMLWPDMLWFWIVAYDIWNFAYTYNCLPDHAWYCGLALLLAPTFAAFFIKKGAWLQHRAHTLAIWCMFAMTYPDFIDKSQFAVRSSHNTTALFIVSFAALASNIAVFVYYAYKIAKTKRNPLKDELYTGLKSYNEIKTLAQ